MTDHIDRQPAGLPAYYVEYLAKREADRRNATIQRIRSLTDREAMLVREAAVMGWVQGARHHDIDVPPDSTITLIVVEEAMAFPKDFPTLGAAR